MLAPYLEKSYNFESISIYRKKSISQKIRRDLLKTYILFPDKAQAINKLISEFNSLTDSKYENVEDVLQYSYEEDFNCSALFLIIVKIIYNDNKQVLRPTKNPTIARDFSPNSK